jgi:hypothetical protein
MLKITQHTPDKMILEDKRRNAGIAAALFTVVSAGMVLLTAVQAYEAFIVHGGKDLMFWRYVGVGSFLLIGIGLTGLGLMATLHFLYGVTWTLDKDTETVTIEGTAMLRRTQQSYPIYGVSRLDIERNAEARAYGVFLVLRSGERVPITAYAAIDHEYIEPVITQVRAFLRSVGGSIPR